MAEAAAEQAHPGPHEGDPNVLDFKTPEKDERPWQLMALDGHPVQVREPKNAYYLSVATQSLSEDEATQLQAVNDILFKLFDDDSREHIKGRLDDDDDDFDVDDLGDVVARLQEVWGKGRGGSAGSSRSSSRTRTKRSTARRR